MGWAPALPRLSQLVPGPGCGIAFPALTAGYGWDFGAEVSAAHCWCGGGVGLEHVAHVLVCMCVHTRVCSWACDGQISVCISFIVLIPSKMK